MEGHCNIDSIEALSSIASSTFASEVSIYPIRPPWKATPILAAGGSGKLKFPNEHTEWTRTLAEQGYARIAAENAAKAEKKS